MMIMVNGIITGMLDKTIANSVELETGHIKVYPNGYYEKSDLLPLDMHIKEYTTVTTVIQSVNGVLTAAPRIRAGGMLQYGEETIRVIINGIDPDNDSTIRDLPSRIVQGEYLTDGTAIIIGEQLAERLDLTVTDEVLLTCVAADGTPRSVACTIKGVYYTGFLSYDSSMVFLPLSQAKTLVNLDGATEIVVMVDNPGKIEGTTAAIASVLQDKGYDHTVYHWEELAPELAQFAEMEKSMSFLFLSIVVIVAAIGILNTMLMAVYERVKEVGVMAAFGYKPRNILVLFVLEGFIIGVVGAVLGGIAGIGINAYLSRAGLEFTGADVVEFMETRIYTRLSVADVVYPFLFAIAIALVAALYPAYKASKLEPVEALRHV